jgi:hypothetical protein
MYYILQSKHVEDAKITLIKHLGLSHELFNSEKKHETSKKIFFLQPKSIGDGHYNY